MDMNRDDLVNSLELHLFFARIMKEHAFFLRLGFLPPDRKLAQEAGELLQQWEALLSRAIAFSSHVARTCVLKSGEVFTEFTLCAEEQTQRLTGAFLNRSLTTRAMALQGWDCREPLRLSPALARQVHQLNRQALTLVNRLIRLKERILAGVDTCCRFTGNYPLLVEHILREAQLYRACILQLEGLDEECRPVVCGGGPFWNRIMMEHALFMRGLFDPTEEVLIQTANTFAEDYRRLLDANQSQGDRAALPLTQKLRDFKRDGVKGIEECEIRSLILPLLADHVLREANHYLRLMNG